VADWQRGHARIADPLDQESVQEQLLLDEQLPRGVAEGRQPGERRRGAIAQGGERGAAFGCAEAARLQG